MTDVEEITVNSEGYTLSLLIWERFQAPAPGVLGKIFALNPRLSLQGTRLAVGTVVRMPVINQETEASRRVTLWD